MNPMKTTLPIALLLLLAAAAARADVVTLNYGRFGPVQVVRQTPHPKHIVFFLYTSKENGASPESPAIGEIEKTLTGEGAAVIAVDLKRYFTKAKKEPDCYHLAGALEMLGKRV